LLKQLFADVAAAAAAVLPLLSLPHYSMMCRVPTALCNTALQPSGRHLMCCIFDVYAHAAVCMPHQCCSRLSELHAALGDYCICTSMYNIAYGGCPRSAQVGVL
jgi:hypothetical protein